MRQKSIDRNQRQQNQFFDSKWRK